MINLNISLTVSNNKNHIEWECGGSRYIGNCMITTIG